MTNSELQKKISRKSGTPETESAVFFELLVKKISKVLKDEEIIKLDDIGFFKIENRDRNKILIFSTSQTLDKQNSIFYLINDFEPVSEPVDSYFSISLDKPEIPLTEHIDSEFFIPPAGNELRSFMESKADDLLLESKIIKTESISEEKAEDEIIEAPKIQEDEEIKITDEITEEKEILSEDEFEKSGKFEELSVESEKDIPSEVELEKTDVFEESSIELEKGIPQTENEDSFSNAELQEIKEDFFKDDSDSEIKIEDYNFSEEDFEDLPEPEENAVNEKDKFQRVSSLSSKIPIDHDEASNLSQDSKKISSKKPAKEEIDEKGFSKVKFNRIKSIEDEQKEENLKTSSLDDYELIDESILNEDKNLEKSISNSLDEKDKEVLEEKSNEAKEKAKVERRDKIPLVPIIILILIAGAAFVVYKFLGNNNQNNSTAEVKSEAGFSPSDPEIIARNYDIPVNYPYKKGDDLLFNAIDLSVYSSTNSANGIPPRGDNTQKTVEAGTAKVVSEDKPVSTQKDVSQSQTDLENAQAIPAENYQEIKNYIYFDGKIYFVQVASWNSLARAERQNSNLLKKGYDSLIEKLITPSGRIYYIVRLGSFNTLQEAEKYLRNN